MTEDSNSAAVSSLATEVACKVKSKCSEEKPLQDTHWICPWSSFWVTKKMPNLSSLFLSLYWVITLKWGAGLNPHQAELWEEEWGVGRKESKGKGEKVAKKGEGIKVSSMANKSPVQSHLVHLALGGQQELSSPFQLLTSHCSPTAALSCPFWSCVDIFSWAIDSYSNLEATDLRWASNNPIYLLASLVFLYTCLNKVWAPWDFIEDAVSGSCQVFTISFPHYCSATSILSNSSAPFHTPLVLGYSLTLLMHHLLSLPCLADISFFKTV